MQRNGRVSERVLHGLVLTVCVVVGFAAGSVPSDDPHATQLVLVLPTLMAFIAGAVSYRHEWWALVPIAIAVPLAVSGVLTIDTGTPIFWVVLVTGFVLFACAVTAALGAGAAALVARLMTGHHST